MEPWIGYAVRLAGVVAVDPYHNPSMDQFFHAVTQ